MERDCITDNVSVFSKDSAVFFVQLTHHCGKKENEADRITSFGDFIQQ